jgi:transposase
MDTATLRTLGALHRAQHRGAHHCGARSRRHPEQAFRTCLGVLKLFRGIETARVEAVAARAVAIGALTYKSVASILQNNVDRASPAAESASVLDHTNVRGRDYFH